VADILQTVVAAVDVPVTLKIRTGWSPEERNGINIAHIAEDAGIQALSVHGRTRACRFKGEAEYETIAQIKSSVSIPIIANGDINTPEDAARVMAVTGADAVMIGRAAQGRPWLCGQVAEYLDTGIVPEDPDLWQQATIMTDHLRAIHRFYGEFMGVRIARKHIGWYLHPESDRQFRKLFNSIECPQQQLATLHSYLAARAQAPTSKYRDIAA
jgi:tRNA-dihydrouridine synthase B